MWTMFCTRHMRGAAGRGALPQHRVSSGAARSAGGARLLIAHTGRGQEARPPLHPGSANSRVPRIHPTSVSPRHTRAFSRHGLICCEGAERDVS